MATLYSYIGIYQAENLPVQEFLPESRIQELIASNACAGRKAMSDVKNRARQGAQSRLAANA